MKLLSRINCIFLSFYFLTCFYFGSAQVKTKIFREGIPKQLFPVHGQIAKKIEFSPPNTFRTLKAKNINKDDKNNKFAVSLITDVDFFLNASQNNEGGFSIYVLNIMAKEAINLSLEFGDFFLSENSILSIYTDKELTDSITSAENNSSNIWATRVYQGNSLNIVLKEPMRNEKRSRIQISKINFGYKKFGMQFGNPGDAADCHFNVACPVGNAWNEERNSVALIVANGHEACSGALVMNTCNTNIPYLLTANHCLQAGNVSNWVFQFQYWSTTCIDNNGMVEDVQFNGCQLRANTAGTDFALLELNQTPAANSGLRFAGWSRQSTGIQNTTIIHHPRGDVMKISVDDQAPVQHVINNTSCWLLDLDVGETEDGSSGAPYFNQDHRIIGQHYGIVDVNLPVCSNPQKVGGRFDLSWSGGGTNGDRLSNWLDPSGSNALTTNTTNVSSLLPRSLSLSITGGSSSICTNGNQSTYTLNGAPAGYSIVWAISNPGIANPSYNGNQATITKTGNGSLGLTATVGGNCFSNNIGYKTIRLGTYLTSEYNITQWPSTACLNQIVTFSMPWYYYPPEPGTTYNWTWSGMTYVSGQGTNVLTLRAPSTAPFSTPWVIGRANNSCGSGPMSPTKYLSLNTGCWSPYRVSPNPSSDYIKIETNRDNGILQTVKAPVIVEVQIIDKMGMVRLKKIIGKGSTPLTIPVYNLPSDIYTLRIFDGQNWYSHKVSILH